MSPPEVLHRIREAALKQGYRNSRKGWEAIPAGQNPFVDLSFLRHRLAAGAMHCDAALARLEQGRLCGLGRVVDDLLGDAVWHLDPVTMKPWPGADTYCFDIDVRSTGATRGDVKFVWEINRLQVLHPLAASIAASPEPAQIDRLFAILESWMRANPPYRGVNWFSGIELAMRMVTFTLIIAALPSQAWTPQRQQLMHRMIAAHAFWLHRYPSRFSSANNHLVAEGLGLLLAGLLAPEADKDRTYLLEGRRILEQEALRQIYVDGVGGEQSPTYQAFTMEMLAFGALIAEGCGQPLAATVTERLMSGARFLQCLMDERGQCPKIGDDDEGRVVGAPPDREPRYTASITAAIAGLTGDATLLPPDRDTHLRDAIFAVPQGVGRAGEGLHHFGIGGYSIGRQTVQGRSSVITFDHGPLGYLSLAAHGHADALAVWLSIEGTPVLVDAGTYLYHSGGALRNGLRSSGAHNTLTIGEISQSLPSSAFSWSVQADARATERVEGDWWRVSGTHDGYRKRFGVTHERTVAREPQGYSILDRLIGGGKALPAAISFLINDRLEVVPGGGKFTLLLDGQGLAEIIPPTGLKALQVRGDREQGRGLMSNAFGHLTDATQLVLTGDLGPEPVMTRIVILPRNA